MIEQLTTDEATVWTVAGTAVLALGAVAALQAKRMAAQANRARVRVRRESRPHVYTAGARVRPAHRHEECQPQRQRHPNRKR